MTGRACTAACVLTTILCVLIGRAAALDTIWDFNGGLTASSGSATMSYRGDMGTNNVDFFASEHDLGLPMPFGDHSGVMRFQPTTPKSGAGGQSQQRRRNGQRLHDDLGYLSTRSELEQLDAALPDRRHQRQRRRILHQSERRDRHLGNLPWHGVAMAAATSRGIGSR